MDLLDIVCLYLFCCFSCFRFYFVVVVVVSLGLAKQRNYPTFFTRLCNHTLNTIRPTVLVCTISVDCLNWYCFTFFTQSLALSYARAPKTPCTCICVYCVLCAVCTILLCCAVWFRCDQSFTHFFFCELKRTHSNGVCVCLCVLCMCMSVCMRAIDMHTYTHSHIRLWILYLGKHTHTMRTHPVAVSIYVYGMCVCVRVCSRVYLYRYCCH